MASALAFDETRAPGAPGGGAMEIEVLWRDMVRDVRHIQHGDYVVGEAPDADWALPLERLGHERWTLLRTGPDGACTVSLPATATVEMMRDGLPRSLEVLRANGRVFATADSDACITPAAGETWRIAFEDVVFVLRPVPSPKRLVLPSTFDWRSHRTTVLSVVAHTALFLMIWSMPPEATAISLDDFRGEDRFSGFMITPPDIPESPTSKMMRSGDGADAEKVGAEGSPGRTHAGPEGKAGSPRATSRRGRLAIAGSDAALMVARHRADSAFRSYLGVYRSATSTITSEFGAETALGDGEVDALGALVGDRVGEASGAGGWGLYGDGPGGGGDSELIGFCKGDGCDDGPYRPGTGLLADGEPGRRPGPVITGAHHEEKIEVDMPTPIIRGSLSREIIRRVIRRHLAEVKHCYERELPANPGLHGKVTVFFIIDPTGTVARSEVDASTIHNANVESCLAHVAERFRFPAPELGGIVEVRYPFVFHSSSGH